LTLTLQYKGFDYVAFFNGAYEDDDSLPQLAQTGANSIEATLDYGIDVNTSQVVADPNYTDSLAALGSTIAQAEHLGLTVMVRPLIDFLDPSEIGSYSVGEWRQDYQPTNVATFFASYQQMIVAEAEVAQANGAQMFSIGAELDQLAGSQYLSYWTSIINAVRAVFSGKLTYSASWQTAANVSFWNELDYEGIDCYVPLSTAANPTLQDLINGWTQPATQSSNPNAYAIIGNQSPIQYFENLSAQSGKPLIFTELGYANDSGAAAEPFAEGNSPDPTLQAELYQAFFDAWQQSGNSSLVGTYFWEWDPNSANGGPGIDSFSPQNNPAQAAAASGFASTAAQPPPPSPTPATPAGTTADMIMRDGNTGDYEIYDVGSSAILAAGPLGQVGLEWQVCGVGGFDGSDTSDMILRDSNNGQFEVYDISNNNITNATGMGQVGLEWMVSGFGDFSSRAGETDMLMRNSNTGAFELFDIGNNQIMSAEPMGQVGLEWSIAGFGDFSTRPNETDMLTRNNNTGAFEVYDISNNQIASAGPMGQVGLEWSVVGFGDFSGNANETDMLMRNSNTGAFEVYDISNNTITFAAGIGQVGLEWTVAGFGPLGGAGSSDMLMRNTNTGVLELYDISNNQITAAAQMGQVGLEWTVAGIAADSAASSAASSAQLAQAMASSAPAGNIAPSFPQLDQAAMQPTAASLFAS
jgi:hypothetical protein